MIIGTKEFEQFLLSKKLSKKQNIAIKKFKELRVHTLGNVEDSVHLMKKYQPSEPEWAIDYKKENFRPITKKATQKILSIFSKIRIAPDFVIKENEVNPKIKEEESLYNYCINKLDIVNWFFNHHFTNWVTDANGIVLFLPEIVFKKIYNKEIEVTFESTQYLEPKPYFFDSEKVIEVNKNFALILIDERKFLHIGLNEFTIIEKKYDRNSVKFTYDVIYTHNLNFLPIVVNGGNVILEDNQIFYESFINGIIPDFDQALLENIDKNVAIKMHVYPEKAIYGQYQCNDCDGTGQSAHGVTCKTCNGTGQMNSSAFGVLQVRPAKGGESELPSWAPAKYIEKDLESVKFITDDIKYLINQGYEAVNMAHLNEVPQNTSGNSKAYDWEQTNLFLYKVADYICQDFLYNCIEVINIYRNSIVLNFEAKEIQKQMLIINTPQTFDILGVSQIEEQISLAKQRGISPSLLEEMEKEYIRKKFAGDKNTIDYHLAVINLDPLRGTSYDDILTMQSLGTVTKTDITIHNLINLFVQKAFELVPNFEGKKQIEQFKIIESYANEYLKQIPTQIEVI
jgi:hypothetical protein